MYVCIYLSIYLSIYVSICLSMYLIHVSICKLLQHFQAFINHPAGMLGRAAMATRPCPCGAHLAPRLAYIH